MTHKNKYRKREDSSGDTSAAKNAELHKDFEKFKQEILSLLKLQFQEDHSPPQPIEHAETSTVGMFTECKGSDLRTSASSEAHFEVVTLPPKRKAPNSDDESSELPFVKVTGAYPKKHQAFFTPISPIRTANSFASLNDEEIMSLPDTTPAPSRAATPVKTVGPKRLPPIILHGLKPTEVNATAMKLVSQTRDSVELKCRGRSVSVYTKSKEDWAKVKDLAATADIEFYTHPIPEDRRHAWVMRGAYAGFNPEEIEVELKEKFDLSVKASAMSRRVWENGTVSIVDMPLFQVTLDPGTAPERLLQVRTISCFRVTWEKKRGKAQIAQCHRCQRFGHGSSNCGMKRRCVKCNEVHELGACKNIDRINPATCVNCGANHPANYRDCPARAKFIANRAKKAPIPDLTHLLQARPIANPSLVQQGISYAQAAAQPAQPKPTTSQPSPLEQISSETTRLFGVDFFTLRAKCDSFMAKYQLAKDDSVRKTMLLQFATTLSFE